MKNWKRSKSDVRNWVTGFTDVTLVSKDTIEILFWFDSKNCGYYYDHDDHYDHNNHEDHDDIDPQRTYIVKKKLSCDKSQRN